MSPRLRLLILAVSERCDHRCAHCQIWIGPRGGPSLGLDERLALVDAALAAGVREALLTGGEPLLSPDLWPIAARLRRGGARVLLATNGMRLAAHAAQVAVLVDEVYVSLDGAGAETHDALRGGGAFERLRAGVAALRAAAPRVRRVARVTLHARNLAEFAALVETARRTGFHAVSFLPLDATSHAFGGRPEARRALLPAEAAVGAFEAEIGRLEADGALSGGFVLESPEKLRRLARHLRASAGGAAFERPPCDAPWWSVVVEADGSVRPCFFHAPIGDAREGLGAVLASARRRGALAAIEAPNPVCERCVCPKRRELGLIERLFA